MFTYNYGDYLVEVGTLKTRELYGGYVWSPDSTETIDCGKSRHHLPERPHRPEDPDNPGGP